MTVEALTLPGVPPPRCTALGRHAHDGVVTWQQRCALQAHDDDRHFFEWIQITEPPEGSTTSCTSPDSAPSSVPAS